MKLINFSVTNFRSITKAHKINLSNISTLVWKNNEWKSNILKALNISMNTLKKNSERLYQTRIHPYRKRTNEEIYCWDRDFPIQLRNKRWSKNTTFNLEFEFTDEESLEFKSKIGSYVNWILHIEITVWEDDKSNIKIKKRGKWTRETWAKNAKIISEYIASKINFTYIPAVRTENHALSIVENMIEKELSVIESDNKYIDAINTINNLQIPILDKISKKIEDSLKNFIPEISKVEAKILDYWRRISLRWDTEILIDDWNKTNIEYKWDWVKSLVALTLLKDWYTGTWFSLIALEEPESHLHPWAIHSLRESIYELWESNQVIITTHNPLFVNSDLVSSNIIVTWWNAKEAKNIWEIREILWVRVSDNLSSARYVLVVEGIEDELSLKFLLSYFSPKIKRALINKLLVIDNIKWAWKLSYKLSWYKTQLCKYHVLLDSDVAGKDAFKKANEVWLLETINTTFTIVKWKLESEFEDLLNPNIYSNIILNKYWVNINCNEFNSWTKKWSNRIKDVFINNWKMYDQKLEDEIKNLVAESIKWNENIALFDHNKNILENLIDSLENLIND